MDLGYLPMPAGYPIADGARARALAQRVEEAGAESLWTVEHVVVPDAYASQYPYARDGKMGLPEDVDLPDPLEWLAYVAACTTTLRLGTAMLILPEHNPVILAKRLATLDRLSDGRLLAGVGIGWLEEEYDALGVPFDRRGARADDYLQAMTTLWQDAPATHHGEFASFSDVHSNPRPVGTGVHLVIGGHSIAAARRAGRFAQGFYPLGASPERLRELRAEIDAGAREMGRDPEEIALTAVAPRTAAELDELRTLGVRRVIMASGSDDADHIGAGIERYRREVIKDLP